MDIDRRSIPFIYELKKLYLMFIRVRVLCCELNLFRNH